MQLLPLPLVALLAVLPTNRRRNPQHVVLPVEQAISPPRSLLPAAPLAAAETTAVSDRNRESEQGPRPAKQETRSRVELTAGSRNPEQATSSKHFSPHNSPSPEAFRGIF